MIIASNLLQFDHLFIIFNYEKVIIYMIFSDTRVIFA